MIRVHAIWADPLGRIKVMTTTYKPFKEEVADFSCGELPAVQDHIRKLLDEDIRSWRVPGVRLWDEVNGQPRITPELPEDFEFPRALIVPEDEAEDVFSNS